MDELRRMAIRTRWANHGDSRVEIPAPDPEPKIKPVPAAPEEEAMREQFEDILEQRASHPRTCLCGHCIKYAHLLNILSTIWR